MSCFDAATAATDLLLKLRLLDDLYGELVNQCSSLSLCCACNYK